MGGPEEASAKGYSSTVEDRSDALPQADVCCLRALVEKLPHLARGLGRSQLARENHVVLEHGHRCLRKQWCWRSDQKRTSTILHPDNTLSHQRRNVGRASLAHPMHAPVTALSEFVCAPATSNKDHLMETGKRMLRLMAVANPVK